MTARHVNVVAAFNATTDLIHGRKRKFMTLLHYLSFMSSICRPLLDMRSTQPTGAEIVQALEYF